MAGYTAIEQRIDRAAHALIDRAELRGVRAGLVEFAVFVAKQAWACVFGFLLLAVIVAARLWYPDDAWLARNDALTLTAVAIQVLMLATRLETIGELRVVLLFHVAGTVMELFKTAAGSWQYDPEGLLRIGAVPLFSGFMYAAVGSYMVRVYRLFDLRFDRYPRRWITVLIAAGACFFWVLRLMFFGTPRKPAKATPAPAAAPKHVGIHPDETDFDPDAALARYMDNRTGAGLGDPPPSNPRSFGRKRL